MADGLSVGDIQQEKSSEEFSPQVLTLSQILSVDREDKPCHIKETDDEICKLKQDKSTDTGDDKDILENMINSMTTFAGLKEETLLKIVKLLGQQLSVEIKSEANYYRLKRSREDNENIFWTPEEKLDKEYLCEKLHVFFESVTGKSGRNPGPQRHKIACIQATFYDSLLKGANLKTLCPYGLSKSREIFLKNPSRQILKENLGGSYTFLNSDSQMMHSAPIQDPGKGPVISDNAQRGTGKFQHHAYGKLDRSVPLYVCTHNIRAESINDDDDNTIFNDPLVSPSNNEFHPLFRPVSEDFLEVVCERQGNDEREGLKGLNTILQSWIDEVDKDRKIGNGVTSFEILSEQMNFGDNVRKVICSNCHTIYEFQINSKNICSDCGTNPTFYDDTELGPYKQYEFPTSDPNTVIARELEPIPINPNGRTNLLKLSAELKEKFWKDYKSFPFYGDGLPAATLERMKTEYVVCRTHDVTIPLIDSDQLSKHCKQPCCLDWPLKDLAVISGASHEEIMMNVTALTLSTNFGLFELLSEMGRKSKKSHMQAIKTKRLHTLFELNYIFMRGSMTALLVPFVADCARKKVTPTVREGFKNCVNAIQFTIS